MKEIVVLQEDRCSEVSLSEERRLDLCALDSSFMRPLDSPSQGQVFDPTVHSSPPPPPPSPWPKLRLWLSRSLKTLLVSCAAAREIFIKCKHEHGRSLLEISVAVKIQAHALLCPHRQLHAVSPSPRPRPRGFAQVFPLPGTFPSHSHHPYSSLPIMTQVTS